MYNWMTILHPELVLLLRLFRKIKSKLGNL